MQISGTSFYHLVRRILLVWFVEVVALWAMASILPGLHLEGWRAAIFGTAAIGLFNALVRPALVLLTLPFTVFTFGILTIFLNAAILAVAGRVLPGLWFSDLGTPLLAALGLAAINTLIASILSLNDEDSFYRNMVKRIRAFSAPGDREDTTTGLIFLEIDGLALPVLRQAMRDGHVPTLSSLVASGKHKIMQWDCGLPSQTSSSQAGIMWGNSFDIPGFRWYDKETSRLVQSSSPTDAGRIEDRIRNESGLLRDGGMSIGNMLSGGAAKNVLTVSTFGSPDRIRHTSPIYFNFYINPYNFTRIIVLMFWEIVVELWENTRSHLRGIKTLTSRGGSFPFRRAMSTVLQHELLGYLLSAEMFAGVPVAYATFVGYDVMAHHAGPYREDSLRILRDVDRRIKTLMRAAEDAPRKYKFVFLSDHGQTPSIPFQNLHGQKFDEVVTSLLSGDAKVHAPGQAMPGWGHVNSLLSETIRHERLTGQTARRLLKRRTTDGVVSLGGKKVTSERGEATVVVCPSGNLGLIYLTETAGRMTLEEIVSLHPRLIEGLVAENDIGFVMVHSRQHGPIVLGSSGVNYLRKSRVEGTDPLSGYGENARKHLLRLDSFPHTGDIVVNGRYDPGTEKVICFENLVGTHGGLGGAMMQPFLLYPADWHVGSVAIDDASVMHNILSNWRASLGPDSSAPPSHSNDMASPPHA